MALTQQTFLGASIRSYNASLGWQNQVSQLSVSLVEDPKNSDLFTDPTEGTPVIFRYDTWTFEGIIQSKKTIGSSSGNPVYEVVVVDPRELLDGVSLIIDSYNGTVSNVPNLMNIFGFIENDEGFGGSETNEAGMPWRKIKDTATALINGDDESIYGGRIQFKGFKYEIDINDLPNIPDFYRVAGDVITLMDFINDICTAGGHDFFFELIGNTITLSTIDRRTEPVKGAIERFVLSTPGAVSKDVGVETRNEVTSKFVVGDSVKAMFAQFPADNEEDDFTDDTIWPYWGLNEQGDPIIGKGFDDNHTLTLDSRHIDVPGIGSVYTTDIEEMRAAAESQESWENFLEIVNDKKFKFSQVWPKGILNQDAIAMRRDSYDAGVRSIFSQSPVIFEWNAGAIRRKLSKRGRFFLRPIADAELNDERDAKFVPIEFGPAEPLVTNVQIDARMYSLFLGSSENLLKYSDYYEPIREDPDNIASTPTPNPHFMKASRVGLVGEFSDYFTANLSDFTATFEDIAQLNVLKLSPFTKGKIDAATGVVFSSDELKKTVYDFVFRLADQYYGKKFMVRIPFVFTKKDDVTGEIVTSQEPTDGGFIDENDFDEALANNLIPLRTQKFTLQDGRFEAYVRFNNAKSLNLEELDEQDYVFSEDLNFIFIKCEVEPNIIFLNKETSFSPRVIITLPARVTALGEGDEELVLSAIDKSSNNKGKAVKLLESALRVRDPSLSDDGISQILKRIFRKPGADAFSNPEVGLSIIPDMVAVPLRSNIQVYGPWFAIGAQGKVEFEQDTNLVPWNFDGFNLLNQAGNARVTEAVTSQTFSESGSITFPDVPAVQLGSRLISAGPYVTNIQLSIGDDGVTTTYQMQTWTNKFGKINKANIDRQQRQAKANQAERRKKRGDKDAPPGTSKYYQKRKSIVHKRNKSSSSHGVLIGNAAGDTEKSSNVFIQPAYHTVDQLTDEYNQTSVMSLDGMFRPFSTWIDYSGGMPNFQAPISGAVFPTINDLNPFPRVTPASSGVTEITRCDISILAIDETVPDVGGLITEENQGALDGNYRPLALRGPLVICGWGLDTQGRPVPNASGDNSSDQFASGYLEDYGTWPVGPVDLRWSHESQIWQTAFEFREGYLSQTLTEASNGGKIAGSGLMQPWKVNTNGEWLPNGDEILVTIRDTSFTGTQGSYIQVTRIGNEFRPLYIECTS